MAWLLLVQSVVEVGGGNGLAAGFKPMARFVVVDEPPVDSLGFVAVVDEPPAGSLGFVPPEADL